MFKLTGDLKTITPDAVVEEKARVSLQEKVTNVESKSKRFASTGRTRNANTALMYDLPRRYDKRKYDKDLPKEREELNNLCLNYYLREPIVNRGIRLAVDFPLSQFTLTHEDPGLAKLFNEISEELNLFQLMYDLAFCYYIYGEAVIFSVVDDAKNPTMITEVDLLNPSWTEIISHKAFTGREYEILYHFHKDPYLKKLCTSPTSDFEIMLANKIPADISCAVTDKIPIRLSPLQGHFFKRVGDPLSPRGQSIIYPALNALMYQDDLTQTQRSIMRRHVAPQEIYKVGTDDQPATPEELEALRDALQNTWQTSNNALIWHHALQVQIEGSNGRVLPLQPEYDWVEKQVLYSLGIPKSFLDAENIAYANASVALEVVISNWLTFRQNLENIINQAIFEPICRMHGIWRKEKSFEQSNYDIKFKRKAWLPEFNWDKQYLRRDDAKIGLLQNMVRDGLLPSTMVQDALNFSNEQIFEGFKSQYDMQRRLEKLRNTYGIKAPQEGEAGEGLPGGMDELGGGMPDLGGMGGLDDMGGFDDLGGMGEAGGEFAIENELSEDGTKLPEISQNTEPGLPTAV